MTNQEILKAVINETTDAQGGYTVPEEFEARLLELIQAKSITLPDLETVSMNHEVMYIPRVTSGTTAYWVAETGTITASDMGFDRITLTAKKVASLVEASTEVLEDNNVSLANNIVEQMARDMALEVDNEIINGTGGTFEGLRYTGSFSNAVDANGNTSATIRTAGTVTGSGITGANISLDAISKAIDEVLKDNHDQPDVSYWNPRTVGSLRLLTDGNGRPILDRETWGTPVLDRGVVGNIYGVKVKTSTQMPINLAYTSGVSTAADAIVGKSKMFGIYGNRRGVRFKKDYSITKDIDQFQATMRSAFSIKYPDAYCVIRAILD